MGSGSRINPATGRKARVTASISKTGRAGAIKRSNGKATEKRVTQKQRTVTGKSAIKASNEKSAAREKSWRRSASQNRQRANAAQN